MEMEKSADQSIATAGFDPELDRIKQALETARKRRGEPFYGYSVGKTSSRSVQSLYVGDETAGLLPYQVREVEDVSFTIRIYVRHGNPTVMGSASITLDPFAELDAQIERAYNNALAVSNPLWDLPAPPGEPYPIVRSVDPALVASLQDVKQKIEAQAIRNLQAQKKIRCNSAELYVNLHTRITETSTGMHLTRQTGDLYFEAAMEPLPLPNRQEVHKYTQAIGMDDLDLDGFFARISEETLSLNETRLPAGGEPYLLVGADVVSDFLHAILGQLGAEAEYRNLPHLKEGETIVEAKGDPLTLDLDPFLPLMAETTGYTAEGLIAEQGRVIDKNRVVKQFVSHRMGQYLERPANGLTGNMILAEGSRSREELIDSVDECLEILTFSSLLINPVTLTWSSEIKLAKLHKKGAAPEMIKGGVVSGSIKANLSDCLFSNRIVKKNTVADQWHPSKGYVGPDFMLIRSGVAVAGE